MSTETQMVKLEMERTDGRFDTGEWFATNVVLRYDHRLLAAFIHMHVNGHHGCITEVIRRANRASIDDKDGPVTSVYPTIYGGDVLILRTHLWQGSPVNSEAYFSTDFGEWEYDRLHSYFIDFGNFVIDE